jgi:RHS repeat-associated protein
VLPDSTPPTDEQLTMDDYENANPYTAITYDVAGNKLTERDVNGLITEYIYDARNRVTEVAVQGKTKSKFAYDDKGNRTEVRSVSEADADFDNVTKYEYDSLDRLRKTIHNTDITEEYGYDALGNKIWAQDGRGNRANYTYNAVGWLTEVTDPLKQTTRFRYDRNGNRVRQVAANGPTAILNYDELNRLVEKIDSVGNSTKFGYDANGNRDRMRDVRNSNWVYQYSDSNRLTQVNVAGADSSTYTVTYQYDAARNRTQVSDNGNTNKHTYDELSRLTQVERNFDGATYTTGYQYNKALLTGIQYPGTTHWLNYNYNSLHQLTEVVGFTAPQGMTYDADGALKNITYGNGVVTSYSYDKYRRLSNLTTVSGSADIQNLGFTYDKSNNITAINNKTYEYDANNQLTKAITPGSFMENKETPGDAGFKAADFTGTSYLVFGMDQSAIVRLDYESSSIGLDFGAVAPKVKKILLMPDAEHANHRIAKGTFDLYTSNDNLSYTVISRSDWDCVKDSHGVISITLNQAKSMRYLKIHVWFDDRDSILVPRNRAVFLNELAQMLRVYQEAESRTEEYQYDKAGNRSLTKITLVQADSYTSLYYSNSDRLKTDGKNAYCYDAAGNLVKKGNKFTIAGDNVTFTMTGEGVEYWTYKYDLLNRLTEVRKNGTIVGEYGYDPEGLRVVKRAHGETIHYVFQGTEPIYTKNVTTGKVKSYVYAGTKLFARVDGVIGDTTAKKYWYHSDQVGSVKAVTNQAGAVVWNADYLPFGQQYMKNKLDSDFEEDDLGFTGKGYDSDVELYYFNARWYDADTGRFISEDPVGDPSNPNLYSYGRNNPLSFIDPTGLASTIAVNGGTYDTGTGKFTPDSGNEGGTGGGTPGNGGPPKITYGPNDSKKYVDEHGHTIVPWGYFLDGISIDNPPPEQKQILKLLFDNYWNNSQYFDSYWWQNLTKHNEALIMIYCEMLVFGKDINVGDNINFHKIEALQAALNSQSGVTGIWGQSDLLGIEGVQTLINAKNHTATIDLETMKGIVDRGTSRNAWLAKHPFYKSFINLMEKGHMGELFYYSCLFVSYGWAQSFRYAEDTSNTSLIGNYLGKKAPYQVTPGLRELEGFYVDDLGRVQPWKAYYDQYGRLTARTDYNAGNSAHGIPDVHSHTYEWGPGKTPRETGSHIPGEYQP